MGVDFQYKGIIVTDSRLFERGHMIGRWATGIARSFELYVREEAPINKRGNKGRSPYPVGTLKAGLSVSAARTGVRHWDTVAISLAPYTGYVAFGTGPIVSLGKGMILPLNPAFMHQGYSRSEQDAIIRRGGTRHLVVSGQVRNQFFERAFVRVAARHPSLRGLEGGAFRSGGNMPAPANPYR